MQFPKQLVVLKTARSGWLARVFLIGIGIILLTSSGIYYTYGAVTKSNLKDLIHTKDRPSTIGAAVKAVVSDQDSETERKQLAASIMNKAAPTILPPMDKINDTVKIFGSKVSKPTETTLSDSGKMAPDNFNDSTDSSTSTDTLGAIISRTLDTSNESTEKLTTELKPVLEAPTFEKTTGSDSEQDKKPPDVEETNSVKKHDHSEPANSGSLKTQVATEENTVAILLQENTRQTVFLFPTDPVLREKAVAYYPPGHFGLEENSLPATKISVFGIGVRSAVQELEILFVEDSLQWETPKWVVGHIPTTANPSQQGQGWYFGHLESPIHGEGNVFLRLPEIPSLLANEESIYVVLESSKRKYLYEVYKTDIVYQDDLQITDSGNYDITLVTCVPRFYYDHRLLVTAALVGVSEP